MRIMKLSTPDAKGYAMRVAQYNNMYHVELVHLNSFQAFYTERFYNVLEAQQNYKERCEMNKLVA